MLKDCRFARKLGVACPGLFMPSRREQIRDVLETLASEEQQLSYERDCPHVDVTAELVEQWFSDLFHGKSPGEWPDDRAFGNTELAAISEFHRFYKERLVQLPQSKGTVRTWLECSIWRDIMGKAQTTLERLPDGRIA
jgi:hypothetical protein